MTRSEWDQVLGALRSADGAAGQPASSTPNTAVPSSPPPTYRESDQIIPRHSAQNATAAGVGNAVHLDERWPTRASPYSPSTGMQVPISASDFPLYPPSPPQEARIVQHMRSNSHGSSSSPTSDLYTAMGNGGHGGVNPAGLVFPPDYPRPVDVEPAMSPLGPTEDRNTEMHIHPFKKFLKALWRLLVIVSCILACILACIVWSSACFAFIMLGYCIAAACINCAKHRNGGCHDCPLLCEGIERSLAWSRWGCRHIIRHTRKLLTPRRDSQRRRVENRPPIITPPPRLYRNPTRNRYFATFAAAFDNVVDDLNDYVDHTAHSIEIGMLAAAIVVVQ